MSNFILWALGVIAGYLGGIACAVLWETFIKINKKRQEDEEYKQVKKDFLMTQTQRMKQKAEQTKK